MNRRVFLKSGGLILASPLAGCLRLNAQPKLRGNPFALGVASGDPWPDSVVLWTRLMEDSEPLELRESISVRWRVALDEAMTQIVREGTALAEPHWAHSVHAEVSGLQPDRWYWYQFDVGEGSSRVLSPVGRTRTAPAPAARPDRFAFAFVSCQKYESGYYTALDHLSEEDLSLVIHVGDYIYEKGPGKPADIRPMPLATCYTLEEYRARYAYYKRDPSLQRVHRRFPFAVTPDDHEVSNNYAALIPEKEKDIPGFEQRRTAAYQAYYEHMPLRTTAKPHGIHIDLYRTLTIGTLADLHILDTRQFRDDEPCGDGDKPPCEARNGYSTMMGTEQEAWLSRQLAERKPEWTVLAQQVIFSQIDVDPGPGQAFMMDKWDGYPAARKRLTSQLVEQHKQNVIVLSGDNHNNWAIDVKQNFDNPKSATIGSEFSGTSITSGGDGAEMAPDYARILPVNPHIKFHNSRRGYVRCVVTPARWSTDYRVVPYVSRPGAPVQTRASFVVEAGRAGMQKAAG